MSISKQSMAVLADVLNERAKQSPEGPGAAGFAEDGLAEAELAEAGAAMAMLAADRLNQTLNGYPPDDRALDLYPQLLGDMPEMPVREALITAIVFLVAGVERIDRLAADGEIVFCACGHVVSADEAVDCVDAMLCPGCAKAAGGDAA